MPVRNRTVHVLPLVRGVVLAAMLPLAFPVASAGGNDEVALQCRFPSGLSAIYMLDRSGARVRRADLLESREGRVQTTAAEYRFTFLERDSAYRIDVIIDRTTGNTRRVFGTRKNMERMPNHGSEGNGLVYEAGQCDAQHAELR